MGVPAGRAAVTLRTRLLAALLALLAAVSVVVGVVSVLALDSFLTDRLDSQLAVAGGRLSGDRPVPGPPPTPAPGSPGPPGLGVPGQAEGTLGARVEAGAVRSAGVIGAGGTVEPLADAQRQVVLALPADGRPYTRDLGGTLGRYRLRAARAPDGATFVAGLPLSGVRDTVTRLAVVIAAVAAAGLLLAGVAGAVIVRLALRPLRRVAATATRVAELPLDRGAVELSDRVPAADTDPRTEVGQVGAALNRLLGHVSAALTARQESETRVRQFVADASHELRTPLASIRGYAELTRRGREPVPADVAYALGRVESESTRMTGLVEDLLLLARLDNAGEEGRAVAREPVDLTRLLVDAVSDARVAGPDHRWAVELADEPVEVPGDADRLHQVVANLLGNARTHTPPGTTVTVGLSTADGDVLLRVADDGPGIPAALLPRVFERFARGDSSRSRAAGSTGLGLAIVAAVTDAHGGTVSVDSSPAGTAFTVRLPAGRPVARTARRRTGPSGPGRRDGPQAPHLPHRTSTRGIPWRRPDAACFHRTRPDAFRPEEPPWRPPPPCPPAGAPWCWPTCCRGRASATPSW